MAKAGPKYVLIVTRNIYFIFNYFIVFSYRQIVLRALPELTKLDGIDVTPEELSEALRNPSIQPDEEVYEDAYNGAQHNQQQSNNHSRQQQSPPPSQANHHHANNQNQQPQQQSSGQQQQWRSNSPVREVSLWRMLHNLTIITQNAI